MSISHHPTDETLAAFASGTLDESRALVVAAHVALCPRCRDIVHRFEAVGGELLDRVEPTAMRPDALERTLARINPAAVAAPVSEPRPTMGGDDLPAPLSQYELGPWRRVGFGVQWRSVGVPAEEGSRVFMLKAEPGVHLPHHKHTGTEWTCVFRGAFRHQLGRFGPGDFDEADETMEHHPTVDAGEPCICLVALQGSIELQSWTGKLLQPFVRL